MTPKYCRPLRTSATFNLNLSYVGSVNLLSCSTHQSLVSFPCEFRECSDDMCMNSSAHTTSHTCDRSNKTQYVTLPIGFTYAGYQGCMYSTQQSIHAVTLTCIFERDLRVDIFGGHLPGYGMPFPVTFGCPPLSFRGNWKHLHSKRVLLSQLSGLEEVGSSVPKCASSLLQEESTCVALGKLFSPRVPPEKGSGKPLLPILYLQKP